MTFVLPITIYKLRPRYAIRAALKAKSNDVEKRFVWITEFPTFSYAQLLAWAIDTGYGRPRAQSKFLQLKTPERRALRRYQQRRLSLVMQLFQVNSASELVPRDFVAKLDSSEKADASFILGGLACRIALEQWFQQRKEKVQRFWHLAVYEKYAHPWISSTADPGNSRPDYLVQDTNALWFPAEAKGSFDHINWERIQTGLRQAARVKSVTFTDPSTLATTTQNISDFACVMAHTAETGELEASLVDPAPDEGAQTILEIATDFADADAFFGAIQQYRLLGFGRKRLLPPELKDLLEFEERDLGPDPLSGGRFIIAIPMLLLEFEKQLQAFLVVAEHFSTAFDKYFLGLRVGGNTNLEANWAALVAEQVADTALDADATEDQEVHRHAHRMFNAAINSLTPLAPAGHENITTTSTWGVAMMRLAQTPMFQTSGEVLSLRQWLQKIREATENPVLASSLNAALLRNHAGEQDGVSEARSLNGLLVVHSANTRQGPAPIEELPYPV